MNLNFLWNQLPPFYRALLYLDKENPPEAAHQRNLLTLFSTNETGLRILDSHQLTPQNENDVLSYSIDQILIGITGEPLPKTKAPEIPAEVYSRANFILVIRTVNSVVVRCLVELFKMQVEKKNLPSAEEGISLEAPVTEDEWTFAYHFMPLLKQLGASDITWDIIENEISAAQAESKLAKALETRDLHVISEVSGEIAQDQTANPFLHLLAQQISTVARVSISNSRCKQKLQEAFRVAATEPNLAMRLYEEVKSDPYAEEAYKQHAAKDLAYLRNFKKNEEALRIVSTNPKRAKQLFKEMCNDPEAEEKFKSSARDSLKVLEIREKVLAALQLVNTNPAKALDDLSRLSKTVDSSLRGEIQWEMAKILLRINPPLGLQLVLQLREDPVVGAQARAFLGGK